MSKPAARMGDMTSHGGVIVGGCPTVLIGGKPAARVGDMQQCPMLNPGTPPPPHIGGPISMGSPTVLIGGMPAARMGDMATCAGPPATIAMGCPTVLIGTGGGGGGGAGGGGAASATQAPSAKKSKDAQTSLGEAMIESAGPEDKDGAAKDCKMSAAIATQTETPSPAEDTQQKKHWIEFEFVDSAGNFISGIEYEFIDSEEKKIRSTLSKGRVRKDNIESGSCTIKLLGISIAQWSVKEARVGDAIKLTAEVEGYEDGETAIIEIWKRDYNKKDSLIGTIETKVQANKIEAQWKYEYVEEEEKEWDHQQHLRSFFAPEFYFIVKIGKSQARSNFLSFKDWIEITLKDEDGNPLKHEEYILYMPDGSIRKGKLDENGNTKEEDVLLGRFEIEYKETPLKR